MEFYKLLEGYEARARREHSIQAFFFSLLANMQIAKGKKITVEDLMKHIYPPTELERMKEEIEYRKLVVRKEALEAVKEARAHGDLSENLCQN